MHFKSLRKLFCPSSKPPSISQLDLNTKLVHTTPLTKQQCHAHLSLLELFASAQTKIYRRAQHEETDPAAAWAEYVEMAAARTMKWFERGRRVDLRGAVPPLDVLMVWHALMLRPDDLAALREATFSNLEGWDWKALQHVLSVSEEDQFVLVGLGKQTADEIYPFPDLLAFLDASPSLLVGQGQSRLPNLTPPLPLPSLPFHAAVEAQLVFAKRILDYSWHRMYPSRGADGPQFDAATVRYRRFMTLNRFAKQIRGLESGGRETNGGFFCPTLDVEFVWRTHMLSVAEYRRFSQATYGTPTVTMGDDVVSRSRPDEETSRVYRRVFGQRYDLCLCWSCVDGRSRWAHPDETSFAEELRLAESLHILAGKACSRCGTHGHRGCRERNSYKKRPGGAAQPERPVWRPEAVRRRLARERLSVDEGDMFHGQSRTTSGPGEEQSVSSRVQALVLEPRNGLDYASLDAVLWGSMVSSGEVG